MKRRWCSILAALALCLTLLPATALAEEGDPAPQAEQTWDCGATAGTVTATLSGNTLTITGSGAMVNYEKLSTLKPWNDHLASIQRIVIEDGVTSIGKFAFCKHESLTSVKIPDSVKSMEDYAFYKCTSLNSIQLPSGLTAIGSRAFMNCSALTSIDIPSGVTSIGMHAFDGSGLIKVKIPSGVTTIAEFLFAGCENLTRVEIPDSVNTIGRLVFENAPRAEIYYAGTQQQWEAISIDGELSNKVHTSDSDLIHTVTISGGGTGASGEGEYKEGAVVTVNAGTMAGKVFDGWTVDPDVTLGEGFNAAQAETSFTMPGQDVTLTANWAEAVADANGSLFTDLQDAFNAVASEGSGTVELLKDVTVDQPITMSQGTVTLDGQGYTLTGTDNSVLQVTNGDLCLQQVTVVNTNESSGWGIKVPSGSPGITIRNTATVSGPSGGISQDGGTLSVGGTVKGTGRFSAGISTMNTTLTVEEGAVISGGAGSGVGIEQAGGTLTIKGGTISGFSGLSVSAFGNKDAIVHLTGGTFTGSGSSGSAIAATGAKPDPTGWFPPDRPLSELLDPGYTIYKEDGTALTAEELAGNKTGSGTFTVGCAHASVGTVTSSAPDENGVVTVTATCTNCNQEVTLGTLTMVNNGLTIAYGDTPTLKVQPSEELGVTKYEWPNKDSGAEYTPNTDALSLGTLTFICKVTFADQGGTSHDVNVTFTLNVEKLNITNAKIRVLQGSDASNTVPYNGQGQKPAIEGFLINDNGFPSSYFDVSLVDASGEAAETQTNAGTYKIKLTGKDVLEGTVTLTSPTFTIEKAVPAIEWEGDVVEQRPYTGKPVAPSLTPTVTVAGMTYDGEAVTYSYATAEAGPYKQGLPTNPDTYYVKAALPQQKNYTAAETAGTLKLVITKAAAEITTPPAAVNPAYNGKPQALVTAAETNVGTVQYALSKTGPWSKEIPTAAVPGTYEVWYKVDGTDYYTGVEAQSVAAKIEKATVAAAGASLMVKNGLAKTYTLDLSPYLPALPQGQEYGKLTYELTEVYIDVSDYIAESSVELEGTVLKVPVKEAQSDEGTLVAAVYVTIQSDNFQDILLTVSVLSTSRTPLIITGVTAQGWTYDGTVHPGYTGTPRAEGYTGEFEVIYIVYGSSRKDAGTFRVEFAPMDTDYAGELSLSYTVEQAQVTVKAEDKTAYVGEEMPALTYTVDGLVGEDTLTGELTPACTPDMTKAGSYPITVSGGEVPAGGNYKAIIYQPGTLTVREKPAPPKPVDPKPPVDPDELEVKLEVKEGFAEVPPALRALEHLNTPEKLTQVMRTAVTQTGVPAGNTAVYDVKLMVSTDGGRTWTQATASNFPSGGLTVTLPYPAGTDSGYTFTVVHMFTTTAFGKTPGDTESPTVTNTAQGLRFTVTGLSPISVGWKEKTTGGSSSGGGGSSGGSYSGGGGSRPTSSVTVEAAEHGKVTSDRSSAGSGSPVTLTVQPDRGYQLESLTVTDSRGNKLQLTAQGGGKYAFTMSGGSVTVKAVFAPLAEDAKPSCDGGAACPSRAFTDLKSGAWYHEAVDFVLRSGLMGGYGDHSFKPDRTLTRAQFAQILYNKEGRPAGAGSAPFTDVAPDAWCAPAVAWAAERGVAGGYGGGLFGPDDPITREQLAVMLWRYAGSPAAQGGKLPFADAEQIGAHAREALGWAVQTGVMNGKGGGVLDPKGLATRAHAAQMLKNFLEQG